MAVSKRRSRIGLLINDLEGAFLEPLWRHIVLKAKELNFDLFIFEGRLVDGNIRMHRQHNIIYQLAESSFIDGFLAVHTLAGAVGTDRMKTFLDDYGNRPLVCIGGKIPGYAGVVVDGFTSELALVMHLLLDHQRKKLVYIGGPENNADNEERLRGFREAHKLADVDLAENRVYSCGYRAIDGYRGTKAAFEAAERRGETIDGVVYGNDIAAVGGLKALEELGVSVPMECSVIGFDNQETAMTTLPPLTTVHIPLEELADAAVRYLLDVLEHGETYDADKRISIDCQPVYRQSCGCLEAYNSRVVAGTDDQQKTWQILIAEFAEYLQFGDEGQLIERIYSILASELRRIGSLGMYQNIGQVFLSKAKNLGVPPEIQENLPAVLLRVQMVHGALMSTSESIGKETRARSIWNLRHLIHEELTILNPEQLFAQLSVVLPELGIQGASLAFYGSGVLNSARSFPRIASGIRWQYSYWNGQTVALPPGGLEGRAEMPLPPGADPYGSQAPMVLLFQPVFHQYEHFGFMIFQVGDAEEVLYEGIRSQISGLIKAGRILETREAAARRLRESLHELESYNRSLVNLSMRDELTGLFNRRGFLELGEKVLTRASMLEDPVLLIYIDLDFLKQINDEHGHYQGDNALKDVAAAVGQCIRDQDIPARIGGDEFTVLVPGVEEEQADSLKKRILKALGNRAKAHHRPFPLSVSIGVQICRPTKDVSLERLIVDADRRMYEEKAKRHAQDEPDFKLTD